MTAYGRLSPLRNSLTGEIEGLECTPNRTFRCYISALKLGSRIDPKWPKATVEIESKLVFRNGCLGEINRAFAPSGQV